MVLVGDGSTALALVAIAMLDQKPSAESAPARTGPRGQGLVEYALIIVLIAVGVVIAITAFALIIIAGFLGIANGMAQLRSGRRSIALTVAMFVVFLAALGTVTLAVNGHHS